MKNFITEMFSANGKISSKRVFGGLLVIHFIFYTYFRPGNINIIQIIAWLAGGLLGIGVTEGLFKKVKGDK